MTTLTLTDAAGTPVNHDLTLVQATPDLAIWKNYARNGGSSIGAVIAQFAAKETANGNQRLYGKLQLPEMETLEESTAAGFAPVPTVAFIQSLDFNINFHPRASLQNRKDLLAMGRDLLADALVNSFRDSFVRPA